MSAIPNIDDLSLHRLIGRNTDTALTSAWVRPSEWPNIDSLIGPSDDKIVALYKVPTTTSSTDDVPVAFSVTTSTGTYNVDWGDGTSDTVASGNIASHLYEPTNGTLTSTSYGYKCGIIVVTANTGTLITMNFAQSYTGSNASARLGYGWLDIDMRCPAMTSLSGLSGIKNLTRFRLRACVITSFASMLQDCTGLQQVVQIDMTSASTALSMFLGCTALTDIPTFTAPSLTTTQTMFANCSSLKTIPLFGMTSVSTPTGMFNGCSSLVKIPAFDLSGAGTIASMFNACSSLRSVNITTSTALNACNSAFAGCTSLREVNLFNTQNVTTMANMFQNCASLATIPFFNTTSVTTMASMFQGCSMLLTTPLFVTNSVTTMASMFSGCSSLTTVPLFVTSSVTSMNAMFTNCASLYALPTFNTVLVQNVANMLNSCGSLASIPPFNFGAVTNVTGFISSGTQPTAALALQSCKISALPNLAITFSFCYNLGAAALDEIFTALPSPGGSKVVNITNSRGSAGCTRSIATGKGWVVTG